MKMAYSLILAPVSLTWITANTSDPLEGNVVSKVNGIIDTDKLPFV